MNKEIEKAARKKVEAKMSFYTCAIIFPTAALVLLMLSFAIPSAAFWLRLPIPVLMMVLAIVYLNAFGFPFSEVGSADWQEDEVEREMIRLYRKQKAKQASTEEAVPDNLELKELERVAAKPLLDGDYV